MNTLQDAIQVIGSKISQSPLNIISDGKIHRFGKKDSCWYACHEWEYKGNSYYKILYGDFKQASNFIWQSYDKKIASDKKFNTAYINKTRENQVAIDLEKQKIQKECREKWKPIFDKAVKNIPHSYLEYKNIDQTFSARIDSRGTLLIPMYNHEHFTGVQMIFTDPSDQNSFLKRFSKGVEKKGSICPLIPFRDAEYVYLSEGFATAASIQIANPEIPSICAFDAGNLIHAVQTIRFYNPASKIIICADIDSNNKGVFEAQKCVKFHRDTIYKTPVFPSGSPKEWSDFNDLHSFANIDEVKSQTRFTAEEFAFIEALGHDEETGKYFYISSCNTQVIPISASGHNDSNFPRIISDLNYWKKNYPLPQDDENSPAKVNWTAAKFDLMAKCHRAGEFRPDKLRGVGVWKDKNSYVWNNGIEVYNKPIDSEYFYRKGSKVNVSVKNYDENIANELISNLAKSFNSLKLKNEDEKIILAAWVIQSQIFTVLPWRFWIWLTGDKGTGKSSILKIMGKLCPNYIITTDATEAGITQGIKSNATSIIYDEIESSVNGKENTSLHGIMNLARRMNSNDNDSEDKKMRGTSSGVSITHNTQACFLFGSIRVNITNPADTSRIFFIEMDTIEDQDQSIWHDIESTFNEVIKNKEIIFSYCFNNIETILSNRKIIKNYLRSNHKIESRFADQLSSMLACFHVYTAALSGHKKITPEDVETYVQEFNLLKSNYLEDSKISDAETAYSELMQHIIEPRDQMTVERVLRVLKENEDHIDASYLKEILWTHGLGYSSKHDAVFIANEQRLKNLEKKKLDISFFKILKRSNKYCIEQRFLFKNTQTGNVPVRGILVKLF